MRRRARYVYVAAALAVAAIAVVGARHEWALERALYWVRGTGWAAVAALLGALLATPMARITERLMGRRPRVGPTRRALGISAALLGGLHASVALGTYLDGEWRGLLDRAWLRAGVLALAVLIPLLVTSHPRLVRALRIQLWKPLHRLAYAAAILALLHVLGAPLADRGIALVVFGAALAVWLLRFLPRGPSRNSLPASEPGHPRGRVPSSSKYREYSSSEVPPPARRRDADPGR